MKKTYPILYTERLDLTRIKDTDAEVVFFQRSNEETMKYIKREPYVSVSQALEYIQVINDQFEEGKSITWGIRRIGEPQLLGSICLWKFSEDKKTAEIGYDLQPKYQNLGIMSEAMKAVLEYGFDVMNFSLIEAFTSQYNSSSIKLLESHGFIEHPTKRDEGNSDNRIFEKFNTK